MKHNFNLIPKIYDYQINNQNLVIYQNGSFISINIDLIETIEEGKFTVDIKIDSDSIYIWYTLYKEFNLIHCSIINLTN